MVCSFFHLPKESDSYLLSGKSDVYIFEFSFISSGQWNHSGKWGVTTFREVLSPRPDPRVTGFMA